MKFYVLPMLMTGFLITGYSHAAKVSYGLTLDGKYADYQQQPENYELPGFGLGGEAGLDDKGFSLNHSEFIMKIDAEHLSANLTTVIEEDDGHIHAVVEELYLESVGLGNGLTLRAGRFLAGVGYLNQQHAHVWDFADAPLAYRGLWGRQYIDEGLRINWVAPTDMFVELGTDLLDGGSYPAGSYYWNGGIDTHVVYANIGNDVGTDHSWQAGLSYYSADVEARLSGGHHHDHGGHSDDHGDDHSDDVMEIPSFTGDSKVIGLNLVYKWAPNGDYRNTNFKLQAELFIRDEEGDVIMEGSSPLETTTYDGKQKGMYIQGVYQFKPQWRAGLRYDYLTSDNKGSDIEVMEEAALDNEGISPKRWSLMLDYSPSETSRWRLQVNRDKSYEHSDNQVVLQYIVSFGAHGAHTF